MNNYIISLNNELLKIYEEYKDDINLLKKNIETLLYNYFNIACITGINLTRKKLNLKYIENINNLHFLNFKNKEINNIINNLINDYDIDFELILNSLIYIYRLCQLNEFKNNNIQEIIVMTNNNSCNLCKLLSKQKQNINNLINDLDREHLYCYVQYNIINDINLSILKRLKFSNEDLITNYNFYLVNNIDEISDLSIYTDKQINIIKNNFISIQCNNNVYINNEYSNIDYLIIKYSIKDKLKINNWWENKFNNTNVFINYKSRKNSYQYLVENVVLYILKPQELYFLDEENYNKIKEDIFNGIEIKDGDFD